MKLSNSIYNIPIINNVIIYDETDSTNERAKELGNEGCVHGTLVLSDMQTAGKGRMGRLFSSPKGHGIYMSLLIKPDLDATIISQITLLTALAISHSLDKIYSINTSIKWPNDILYNGKKIVGILTELSTSPVKAPTTHGYADMDYSYFKDFKTNVSYVVIGIGINVNNDNFPSEIKDTASSLFLETKQKMEFEPIITEIFNSFSCLYKEFINTHNLDFIKDQYNNKLINKDKEIYVIPNELSIAQSNPGKINTDSLSPVLCKGIDAYGNIVCIDKGKELLVNSGEVSIRGINSYSN